MFLNSIDINFFKVAVRKLQIKKENIVFVDDAFQMYASQTAVLQGIRRYSRIEIVNVLKMFPDVILEDVNDREIEEEDKTLPWEKKKEEKIPRDLPVYIDVVLYLRLSMRYVNVQMRLKHSAIVF